MNLSNTATYAIRVVAYMAKKQEPMYAASQLVNELKISDKYLKRILTTLSSHGIIKSVQGRYGGFAINRPLAVIHVYDIVAAVENIEKYLGCVLGFETCSDENPCPLHTKWTPVRNELLDFLRNNTMEDIMKNPEVLKF